MRGQGCPNCGIDSSSQKQMMGNTAFIRRATEVHDNAYCYDNSIYSGIFIPLLIGCKIHGNFEQTPQCHLRGNGCPKCGIESMKQKQSLTKEEFIKRSIEKHGKKYNYDEVIYKNSSTKVIIRCKKHYFEQTPSHHLQGQGCPYCKQSKLEIETEKVFNNLEIKTEPQKKFDDCKNINPLPFDFFIPSLNLLIELQGEQHFNADNYHNKKSKLHFSNRLETDCKKSLFAYNNGFSFLAISYLCNDLETAIKNFIGELEHNNIIHRFQLNNNIHFDFSNNVINSPILNQNRLRNDDFLDIYSVFSYNLECLEKNEILKLNIFFCNVCDQEILSDENLHYQTVSHQSNWEEIRDELIEKCDDRLLLLNGEDIMIEK